MDKIFETIAVMMAVGVFCIYLICVGIGDLYEHATTTPEERARKQHKKEKQEQEEADRQALYEDHKQLLLKYIDEQKLLWISLHPKDQRALCVSITNKTGWEFTEPQKVRLRPYLYEQIGDGEVSVSAFSPLPLWYQFRAVQTATYMRIMDDENARAHLIDHVSNSMQPKMKSIKTHIYNPAILKVTRIQKARIKDEFRSGSFGNDMLIRRGDKGPKEYPNEFIWVHLTTTERFQILNLFSEIIKTSEYAHQVVLQQH